MWKHIDMFLHLFLKYLLKKKEKQKNNLHYKFLTRKQCSKQKNKPMKDIIKSKQDLIKNNYLSSKTNHVICTYITNLGKNGEIYVGIDIAARVVIMHCYKKEPLNVKDIIETLTMAIKHRGFLPNIKIIHSDRGSIFKNLPFQQFIEEQGIDISRGSAKGHTNQVMERTFRSLKDIIRDQMDSGWRKKTKS